MSDRLIPSKTREKDDPPPLDQDRSMKKVKIAGEENPATEMETEDQKTKTEVAMEESTPEQAPKPSFKDMLVNNTTMPEEDKDPELELEEADVAYSLKDGIPSINFSDRIKGLMDKSMQFAVIVKVLGRRIRYTTLRDKLPYIWPTIGPYRLIGCAGDCYIVKFSNMQDHQMALLNGPWMIFGHYLSVQPWNPNFSPMDHSINQVIGWVRLPMLPLRYYHKQIVRAIGHSLGKVIKIDYNTEAGARGRFARLAILIDLAKPLVSKINVDDKTIFIEYEGLPTICYHCGQYGHLAEICPQKLPPTAVENNPNAAPEPPPPMDDSRTTDSYGAWMHAPSRSRRPPRTTRQALDPQGQRRDRESHTNPFDVLAVTDDATPVPTSSSTPATSSDHQTPDAPTRPRNKQGAERQQQKAQAKGKGVKQTTGKKKTGPNSESIFASDA